MWWLSFRDEARGFLGVAIVPIDTNDLSDAVAKATSIGCNPGGEVLGAPIDPDGLDEEFIGRLLDSHEAAIAYQMVHGDWHH
jgi:hypothetical protein